MLKILVVDDEVLERKALTKIINEARMDVTVIGEAPNGRKAIEMAILNKPDIIFMDIKMPGIDGVRAVKEIRKIDADIRIIMVSAFNTFEYAKEVMQQGVKEYILKPSRKRDILESLHRVSSEIIEERRQREEQQNLKEHFGRAVSIAQKEWVSSLLMNGVQEITFEEWGELLGVEIISGYIMIFSLQLSEERSADDKQRWYGWLKNVLKAGIREQEVMIGPLIDMQVPVLFLCEKSPEIMNLKNETQATINSLSRDFKKRNFPGVLKVGIGQPYIHADDLNKSYHQALLDLEKAVRKKHPAVSREEREPVTAVFELEKMLLDAVRQGDADGVLMVFDTFASKWGVELETSHIRQAFTELLILLARMLHELGISYERIPQLDESDEASVILEKCKMHLIAVVQHVQVWRNNHAKGMLMKAKDYIEEHYADSITLESVAELVELSPFYFSKLFKDRFGMTFIDYLTEVRIGHAKRIMLDQGKSLKEICYSVGYKDPNYFSRVFKKLTGLSPTQFRQTRVKS